MQVQKRLENTAQSGFTLVEVMVGMFLLAVVFTSAFGSYFLGMRIVEDAREELRASQIIQSELEAMRTMNWADMEELAALGTSQFSPQGTFIQNFANDYISYRYVSNDADKKRVVIWVWWKNSRGTYTFQIFNTVFTKNGINDYYYRQV